MKNVFSTGYKQLASITAILAFVLFLGVNLLSSSLFNGVQLDLTEDSLYTLSDGTEETLQSLDERIHLRFFFSNKLANGFPEVKNYAARIQGMLEQYVSESDGKVTLEIIDPEPFSEDEDLAESYGLEGAPVDNSGTKIYFGLVASNSVDQSQAIPFFVFSRDKFAEYDITRMISDLANPERIKVALITSIPMELPNIPGLANLPDSAGPWAVIEQARQLFDVTTLDIEKENVKIPDDTSLIMVVHPSGFNEKLLYQIDQFVMNKGRALFFVDPDIANAAQADGQTSDIQKLFDKWGIVADMEKVVGDRIYGSPMPQREGDDTQAKLPILSNLTIDNTQSFNPDDIVSANVNIIKMTHATHIDVKQDSGLTLTPLIQSSPRSTLLNVNMVRFGAPTRQLLREFTSDNVQYNLAARIQGTMKSAFPNKKGEDHKVESAGDVNIIVVGDTDILRNISWVQVKRFMGYQMMMPFADNGSFVINAIDNLGGTGNLITLRTRGTGNRPFTVVEELRKEAEERFLSKERELQEELKRTEEALNRLQRSKGEGAENLALSPAQQLELRRFQEKKIHVRKELRGVQRELNKEIESLGTSLKFINIALVPLIVIVVAFFVLLSRSRKQAGGR